MKPSKVQEMSNAIRVFGAQNVIDSVSGMVKKIPSESAIMALMAMDALKLGVHVAHEHSADRVCRFYIGVVGVGIIATYEVDRKAWTNCQSHGNFGKKIPCGGTWSAKGSQEAIPQRIIDMIHRAASSK